MGMAGKGGLAVVLAHGIIHPLGAAVDVVYKQPYFRDLPKALRRRGMRVLYPKVSNMGHVEDRAHQLKECISEWDEREPGERVVLVGHSMGGLDARYMISNLGGDELVSTNVSIGTPHHGCAVADWVMDELPLFANVSDWLHRMGLSLRAVECLTRRSARELNAACPDAPDVRYLSVSGSKGPDERLYAPILRPSLKYVLREEGPNDGMVSIESSKWGEHLGVVPYDHIEQIDNLQLHEAVLRACSASSEAAGAAAVMAEAAADRLAEEAEVSQSQMPGGLAM